MKKGRKEAGKHRSRKGKAPASRRRRRPRKPYYILGGVFAAAVLAAALVIKLFPEPAKSPQKTDLDLKEETFKVARQLMSDFPESAYPLGLMGTVNNAFGNTTEAEDWWRKCLERNPTDADAYKILATAYSRKGEYGKVAELLEKAEAIDPGLPEVHRLYAEAMLESGRLDEALAALQKEMELTDDPAETYLTLGKVQLQREAYAEAVEAYSRVLDSRPDDSRAYYGLATASARLGQTDKAREYMAAFSRLRGEEDKAAVTRRTASARPRPAAGMLAEALVDAGRMYASNQRFQKAEDDWRRAAALDSTNTDCRRELVQLYRRMRRQDEALAVNDQLLALAPRNYTYHVMKGIVLGEMKRLDAAEASMRKAVELAPRQAGTHRWLAEILLLGYGKLPEARKQAELAVDLAPTPRHYALLSRACSRNLDHAGALAAMKHAVELAPDDQQIRAAYRKLQEGP